jgi:H+/Cl- antiporter ClcA
VSTAAPDHHDASGPAGVPPHYWKVLLAAAAIGFPVAALSITFTSAVHGLTELLWHTIPDDAGWDEAPWWWVLLLPTLGGVLVAAALRLPGHGGHSARDGLGLDPAPPLHLVSILTAALATLGFGLVLGPEAPLMALGLTAGLIAAQMVRSDTAPLALAGAFAAISALFGGPFVAALLLFEMAAASGLAPSRELVRLLVPGFLAAGTGWLVFTGVGDWPGVDEHGLAVTTLSTYEGVRFLDLVVCIPLAAGVAVLLGPIRQLSTRVAEAIPERPEVLLVAGGFAVGLLAVLFRVITDRPVDWVLFSGQSELPNVVLESSAGVLALLVVLKGLAYATSIGAGFRGGPIFPAVAIGAAAGACVAALLPGLETTPAVVAGISAGAAASMRLPFFGALLGALLAGDAGADAVPIAILASATACIVAILLTRPRHEPPATT